MSYVFSAIIPFVEINQTKTLIVLFVSLCVMCLGRGGGGGGGGGGGLGIIYGGEASPMPTFL